MLIIINDFKRLLNGQKMKLYEGIVRMEEYNVFY